MDWIEVTIHTTNEAIEPISYILNDLGANGVVIYDSAEINRERTGRFGEIYELDEHIYPKTGVYIKSYLTETEATETKLRRIQERITELITFGLDVGENTLTTAEVKEEDWATAWKKYYKPVQITDRMTIVPKWEDYEQAANEMIIWMDPGMAFGTGTHPTTSLSLKNLEKYLKVNDVVLDVGCGSGILSIAAAKLGAKEVYAYDLDEVAIESSKYNISLNDLQTPVQVTQNNLLENISRKSNLIVANILAEIIIQLVDDAFHSLQEDGLFITSGIINDKEKLVHNHLIEAGFEIVEVSKLEDWVSIVARKPKQG